MTQTPFYVVLASGNARRMGFDKVVTPIEGRSPLRVIAQALGSREFVVVTASRLAERVARDAPCAIVVINDEAERGMAHSLRAGLYAVPNDRNFGVLLGDMPAMTEETLRRTEALIVDDVDVAHPVSEEGNPGHPVIFAARMRPVIEAVPDGDKLYRARDAGARRVTWCCPDRSAFLDLDDPQQWEAFHHA